jgi:hypothetical protein
MYSGKMAVPPGGGGIQKIRKNMQLKKNKFWNMYYLHKIKIDK